MKPKAPPELLAEMFEIQEALAGGRRVGAARRRRARTLAEQRERLLARQRGRGGAAARAAEPGAGTRRRRPSGRRRSRALKEALATRAYLRTVIDDLAEALGEEEETHVAHHRH